MAELEGQEKLSEPELVEFIEAHGKGRLGVLLELDVEPPKVSFGRGRLEQAPPATSPRVTNPVSQETLDEMVEQADRSLQKLLGHPVTWIAAARTFSTEVTAAELTKILKLPHIRAVHPNRKLR